MRDWPKVGGLEEDIPTSPLVDDPASSRATLTYAPRSRALLRPPMPSGSYSCIHHWGSASRAVHSLARRTASEEISVATPTKSRRLTQKGNL